MHSEIPIAAKAGLVLSGGGMRGAYEAGTVAGILEALRPKPSDPPVFRIFSGASVGSINAAFLAANAQQSDHGVGRLADLWRSLKLQDHMRVRPFGLTRWPSGLRDRFKVLTSDRAYGTSLLDTRALEVVVRRNIDWDRLHRVVDSGRVLAVLVAALHVASGRTIMFTEHAPGMNVVPTRDGRRAMVFERLTADHVLASAAIPLLFPTRRIGEHYYCDGGLRFNTPIAPAIRAGADRIVVVTVRHGRSEDDAVKVEEPSDLSPGRDLSPMFLVGKLLNALLLDPVQYDLHVLGRLNEVVRVLEQTLSQSDFNRVQRILAEHRGMPYRHLRTLVFTPSRDLGELAADYLRDGLKLDKLPPVLRFLLERTLGGSPRKEADWASYLLFDGGFAAELIAIGQADALKRRDEIREFFARG